MFNRYIIMLTGLIAGNTVYIPAGDAETRIRSIDAKAATGWNRRFEKPIHIYDDILQDFGFTTIRLKNPSGGQPIPITEDSNRSSIISTYFDPKNRLPFLPDLVGFSLNENAPALRDMPITISRDGATRQVLKPHLESAQLDVSHTGPSEYITLGRWLQARGKLTITCSDNGDNQVRIKMRGLVPNRYYSLWEWFRQEQLPAFLVTPTPLGGIGSDVYTNEHGNAEYVAKTNLCLPMSIDDESPSRAIMAIYHWDHQSHGGVPITAFYPHYPRLPGDIAGVHLWWPIAGGGSATGN